ncbi:DUF2802 domain-containing protein [Thiohalobacter sp. IOR34]|uniref:DUF2802 domain-containing protein n=1 Tax=Thiohalobacter sp. IOR34 TaxID=3057176 RepID=UPI0025B0E919|nr:DUF2802 domain-containing protein [Thiohalobacter sp. IOR34]WJW74550.1 DUF2802 domain-containing protein [Thiohalobacter sp. IOR34]
MELDLVTLILGGTVLALATGLGLLLRSHRRLAVDCQRLEGELERVGQDLAGLCKSSVGAGDHLMQLEYRVRRLTERQDQAELRGAGDRPYSHAIQRVQQGASAETLIEECGLTRGEAELILMLHGGLAEASPDIAPRRRA